jgi:hypothetical protein
MQKNTGSYLNFFPAILFLSSFLLFFGTGKKVFEILFVCVAIVLVSMYLPRK